MITSDWHTHSRNSCDGACIPVADLLTRSAAKGIADLGLTDHLHTPYNLPDIAASRREYLADLKVRGVALCTSSDCHDATYAVDLETAAARLETVGISERDLWRLPPRSRA